MPSSTTPRKAAAPNSAKRAAAKKAAPRKRAAASPAPAPTLGKAYDPTDPLSQDLVVPSGATCRARRAALEDMMAMGVLPQLDRLTALVDQKHIKRVNKGSAAITPEDEQLDVASLTKDPKSLMAVVTMADRIIEYSVLEPKLVRPVKRDDQGQPVTDAQGNDVPLPDEDRVPGTVYTDTVQMDDKMFLFNWTIGGSSDLDRFRAERDAAVGNSRDVQGTGEDA
jgi:hypothetical protein